ncbi:hypothetical protein [Streptomyces sp. KCTC 0041BP]|uniref:hypothetical protein n=1 Tax=Streptomyces sp. KCTC 0041BP TaxID=201500 RepID=UPI001FD753ED|nr:hypothetical protein [Streptomyces sp. KCTC 0041BP]
MRRDPEPEVGALVLDAKSDRIGLVMGHEGPYVQLRPVGGGTEWDADPGHVRLVTHTEALRARVSELNRAVRPQ